MRSPKRKRNLNRRVSPAPVGKEPGKAAQNAIYVGSPEHKTGQSFAGQPRPRSDASVCDPLLNREQKQITNWLRSAIKAGNVGAYWEGDFPRYVWYRDGDTVYEGRLVNCGKGEYKGYPLNQEEADELELK